MCSSFLAQVHLDLSRVIEIVAGEHANDVLDSLLAALGVHAVVFPGRAAQKVDQTPLGK